jgi:hypothetical protein
VLPGYFDRRLVVQLEPSADPLRSLLVLPSALARPQPGKVWFTLEVLVDDGSNRYSISKSAATIGIISVRSRPSAGFRGAG